MTAGQTAPAAHLDPARKHDFVLLLDVRDGNPNGDPDAGGMPRVDPETGHGLITDVAIKRKIRNTVPLIAAGRAGYDIYVEAGVALEAQHERVYTERKLDPKSKTAEAEARQWMCRTFFDVRVFGAVMSVGKLRAGRVQGPVQLSFARSVEPIQPVEHGITRVTQTRQADIDEGESTEMGSKHTVPYGLYLGYGHFSAPLAQRTEVSSEDLAVLWRAIEHMLEHDRAATRGEMALRGLYVFTHDDAFGQAPAHVLFDLVRVRRVTSGPARAFSDYEVEVDEAGVPTGVQLTRLVG